MLCVSAAPAVRRQPFDGTPGASTTPRLSGIAPRPAAISRTASTPIERFSRTVINLSGTFCSAITHTMAGRI